MTNSFIAKDNSPENFSSSTLKYRWRTFPPEDQLDFLHLFLVNVLRPPPIPPRQTKSDEKTTTPPLSTLVLVKQSNSSSIVVSTPSNDDQTENFIVESSSNANDQPLLIQMSPEKSNVTSTIKVNSPPHRYTLANSPSPFVLKVNKPEHGFSSRFFFISHRIRSEFIEKIHWATIRTIIFFIIVSFRNRSLNLQRITIIFE